MVANAPVLGVRISSLMVLHSWRLVAAGLPLPAGSPALDSRDRQNYQISF